MIALWSQAQKFTNGQILMPTHNPDNWRFDMHHSVAIPSTNGPRDIATHAGTKSQFYCKDISDKCKKTVNFIGFSFKVTNNEPRMQMLCIHTL